jgi:hypothetical protein
MGLPRASPSPLNTCLDGPWIPSGQAKNVLPLLGIEPLFLDVGKTGWDRLTDTVGSYMEITDWGRVFLEMLIGAQLVKKFRDLVCNPTLRFRVHRSQDRPCLRVAAAWGGTALRNPAAFPWSYELTAVCRNVRGDISEPTSCGKPIVLPWSAAKLIGGAICHPTFWICVSHNLAFWYHTPGKLMQRSHFRIVFGWCSAYWPWRWRWYIPPKRRLTFNGSALHNHSCKNLKS